jgi:hypothetical protein
MITQKEFDGLKKFDRITDARGYTNGYTWKVIGVSTDTNGRKVVFLVCQCSFQKPWAYVCRWSEEEVCMVNCDNGEVVAEFQGKFAYLHEETVDQVVEEMLDEGRLTKEQAVRFLNANSNDTSHAMAVYACHG